MRIISKFKDYYDSAASFGVDFECVFERVSKTLPFKFDRNQYTKSPKYPFPVLSFHDPRSYHSPTLYPQVLGFCGKLIPFIEVRKVGEPSRFIYSEAEFLEEKESNWAISESSWSFKDNSFSVNSIAGVKKFFSYDFKELEIFFTKYHTPIFIYRTQKDRYSNDLEIELNPKLAEIDFYRIKDAPTTFQEIFMFLSGVLGKVEKDTVNISDQDKIKQHGFDKWSFRKPPQPK